jgi:hypothetical protein
VTLKRGMDAYNNPDFYRQLGKVPEQLTAGLSAMPCPVVEFSSGRVAVVPDNGDNRQSRRDPSCHTPKS